MRGRARQVREPRQRLADGGQLEPVAGRARAVRQGEQRGQARAIDELQPGRIDPNVAGRSLAEQRAQHLHRRLQHSRWRGQQRFQQHKQPQHLQKQSLRFFTTSKTEERIGKLAGTAAIIRVGAPSVTEQQDLKLRIESAVRGARCALRDGVVPGGGASLLACVPGLQAMDAVGDERIGVRALEHALAEE